MFASASNHFASRARAVTWFPSLLPEISDSPPLLPPCRTCQNHLEALQPSKTSLGHFLGTISGVRLGLSLNLPGRALEQTLHPAAGRTSCRGGARKRLQLLTVIELSCLYRRHYWLCLYMGTFYTCVVREEYKHHLFFIGRREPMFWP